MSQEYAPPECIPGFDLTVFDNEYAQIPVDEKQHVPDGNYQVIVERVEIAISKTSGNPMLKWMLRIIGPSCEGRVLWRHNLIVNRENIRWLKHDLHVCGLELSKVSEIPANLERLLDVKIEVAKRTKGTNENVYFNQRIIDGSNLPAPSNKPNETDIVPF